MRHLNALELSAILSAISLSSFSSCGGDDKSKVFVGDAGTSGGAAATGGASGSVGGISYTGGVAAGGTSNAGSSPGGSSQAGGATGGANTGGASSGPGGASSGGTAGAIGSAGASASNAGAAGYPMTPDGACRASIAAQCEAKVRCGLYADLPTCTVQDELCPDYQFAPGSTRSVGVTFACLDTLRNESCPEVQAGVTPTCLTAGTLADDAPCTYSSQCASGLCNASTPGSCTTCRHQAGLGESCNTLHCVPGYFCDPGTKLCTPVPTAAPAAEGEACTSLVGCQGLLGCGSTATSTTPVCHVLPGDTQSCPDGLCAPPLICHLPTANNPICSDPAGCSPPCGTGSHCVNDGASSTCVAYAQLGNSCGATMQCAPGLICKGGQCAAQPHLGDPCTVGDCPRVLTCTNGVCSVPDAVQCP